VYELSVEAEGFQNPRKTVVVQTGSTTRADVQLTVDVLQQAVEAIDYRALDHHIKNLGKGKMEIS